MSVFRVHLSKTLKNAYPLFSMKLILVYQIKQTSKWCWPKTDTGEQNGRKRKTKRKISIAVLKKTKLTPNQ